MTTEELIQLYSGTKQVVEITGIFSRNTESGIEPPRLHLANLTGSSPAFVIAALLKRLGHSHLVIMNDKEEAAYFYNDLTALAGDDVFFFPAPYRKSYAPLDHDPGNVQIRTRVLSVLSRPEGKSVIVTYPEAMVFKSAAKDVLVKHSFVFHVNESYSIDFINELLNEYGFERNQFVTAPGQFAIRGGIIDIFSFSSEKPFRLELTGERVAGIRIFDPSTQLSIRKTATALVIPDTDSMEDNSSRQLLTGFMPANSICWFRNFMLCADKTGYEYERLNGMKNPAGYCSKEEFLLTTSRFATAELSQKPWFEKAMTVAFHSTPQPSFNKNFNLLADDLHNNRSRGYRNILVTENARQIERFYEIFNDLPQPPPGESNNGEPELFTTLLLPLHEGFIDHDLRIACYTDHQIFNRYHRYRLQEGYHKTKEALLYKELKQLKTGDFVVHIDHGIGRFAGLDVIEVNGKMQEAVKIIYRDDDVLYVSIHSLHRISKYSGKDGALPRIDKLGSDRWAKLKEKTKRRVKELAIDLIRLYAMRHAEKGFAFSPDSFLQTELEASFIYEDTPDQVKTTAEIKKDMETDSPMDRLVCGDVGFGKTEVAVRAAFKAVADNKQVALLAPTTILTLQHYKTFAERLRNFPCRVEFLNRFRTSSDQKKMLSDLSDGKVDIMIGTHRILGKDVRFKDLGLLIIDEEQKFGVSAKETIRSFRTVVDTLSLTATPIPRTLQLSLMGARDLSVINTPPPNRYPVQTEVHVFNERIIKDGILYELDRGGQVFFIHNRIETISRTADIIRRLCPDVRIAVAHGRMKGPELERVMIDFIEGQYEVLVCTAIVESGIDIPNANTIFINDAQRFGLSDLHQLRGRVGRSNKHAFCYLLTPPFISVSDEAHKRLKALEDFSDLGSGFNIALRDLDIRGAGNMLGAEQSGFINEIGMETYQKILDEAVMEIKMESNLKIPANIPRVSENSTVSPAAGDCHLDTDLEIGIPADYINDIAERLAFYRELSDSEHENQLAALREKLEDRFGPLPVETQELFNVIRLRWLGKHAGFAKIILKMDRFTGYFPGDPASPFYAGPEFTRIINYARGTAGVYLREKNNRLSMTIHPVREVKDAITAVTDILKTPLTVPSGMKV